MRSAELQFDESDPAYTSAPYSESSANAAVALKQQIAERLAAHRSKRSRNNPTNLVAIPGPATETQPSALPSSRPAPGKAKTRSSRVAAAVAERYAHSPSYREFLAAEAARAIEEANATAEIAARNAEAVTAVQQQLLAELDLWEEAAPQQSKTTIDTPVPHASHSDAWEVQPPVSTTSYNAAQASTQSLASGLTVRLYEDVGLRQPELRITSAPAPTYSDSHSEEEAHLLSELEEEIAFRHSPIVNEPSEPPTAIPANLIEFPRQLVAARKARPRLAEGPLREEADTTPAAAQLRIFEVDPSHFSHAPTAEPETSLPEWSSIHLDATPAHIDSPVATHVTYSDPATVADPASLVQTALYVPMQVAPLSDRVMAAAVDACILGTAYLGTVCAFAFAVRSLPSLPVAAIASAATLLVLFVLYHLLFFTFADATPGMRYARVGLCTFSDDNPTRAEMRRRTWYILLAMCPLGLGLLWALLDEDGIGWHDRLSRMYQRSY